MNFENLNMNEVNNFLAKLIELETFDKKNLELHVNHQWFKDTFTYMYTRFSDEQCLRLLKGLTIIESQSKFGSNHFEFKKRESL